MTENDVAPENDATAQVDPADDGPDVSDLDEHSQKVIAAIRNDYKSERAKRQAAEDALKKAQPQLTEYQRLVEASKTDTERAQEALTAAQQRAKTATERVARAEVKAALAGVVDNADAIVDDLNLSRFVDEDGEVNTEAIDALRTKYAGFGSPRAPRPDPSQASGANGRTTADPAQEFASIIRGVTRR